MFDAPVAKQVAALADHPRRARWVIGPLIARHGPTWRKLRGCANRALYNDVAGCCSGDFYEVAIAYKNMAEIVVLPIGRMCMRLPDLRTGDTHSRSRTQHGKHACITRP